MPLNALKSILKIYVDICTYIFDCICFTYAVIPLFIYSPIRFSSLFFDGQWCVGNIDQLIGEKIWNP